MATGSAAAAKARRDAAGYWQGASSANSQPRCDNCTHCRPSPGLYGGTQYDRLCELHDAAVKTHGCCQAHKPKEQHMKLELNTNGSWRTVLRGLGQHDAETLSQARQAAAVLAAIDANTRQGRGLSWRLVSEGTEQVVDRCTGVEGWQSAEGSDHG